MVLYLTTFYCCYVQNLQSPTIKMQQTQLLRNAHKMYTSKTYSADTKLLRNTDKMYTGKTYSADIELLRNTDKMYTHGKTNSASK